MNYKRQQILGFGLILFVATAFIIIEGILLQYVSMPIKWGVTVLLALFLLIAGILISIWTIRKTTSRLKQVTDTINEADFNQAEKLPRVHIQGDDEVTNIAEAFNKMSAALELHNRQVKEAAEKTEDSNWVQTQLAQIGNVYQGINGTPELAEKLLSWIVPLLDTSYGLFYYLDTSKDEEVYRLEYAYSAYSKAPETVQEFRRNQGIIGRVAAEQKLINMKASEDHAIRIQTGAASFAPNQIIVIPIMFAEKTIAVMELGTMTSFIDRHCDLIEQVSNNFGAIITSIENRMRADQLLRDTQTLNHELQSQQEELQVQQEELQVQQEELQTANEQLRDRTQFAESKAHELEVTQQELERYTEQLKLSSRYKTEFLANMSHELRTPMNSILILSQLISESDPSTQEEELPQYGNIIHHSAQDLLALIDDILDLSKVEAGMVEVHPEMLSVQDIPEVLGYSFNKLAEQKNIEFLTEIDESAPLAIYTDSKRLQQILKNLLSNAFKFTHEGSVTLKIASAEKMVEMTGNPLPEYAAGMMAISVTDTGIGIADDKQQMVFEAFRQADGSRTDRNYGGTGLGLSICLEFSRLLGGFVTVESEIGKGSTFTLYIPPAPENYDHTESESVSPSGTVTPGLGMEQLQDKKVMIVDDDFRNIAALEGALKSKGINVFSAYNGKEALELMDQVQPDLVLMDMMMPVMDGYETIRHIRSREEWRQLPVIALTAKAMKDDREHCLQAGASDYLSKPLQMEQLFSLLRVWLNEVTAVDLEQ